MQCSRITMRCYPAAARAWAFAQVGDRDDTVASNRRVLHVSAADRHPERVVKATVGEYNGVFALVVE
jgi:hypothetical protein